MLGYLNFRKKDYKQAVHYLETATTLKPRFAQALMLLGRARLLQRSYTDAQSALESAVAADTGNWLSHYLLADAYLQQKNYSRARDEAQISIAQKQKGEAILARIVLGQALVGLGSEEQGIEALSAVLKGSPEYFIAVEHVRDLIKEVRATNGGVSAEYAAVLERDSLEVLGKPKLSVASWLPPSIDDVRVPVAATVPCASQKVVEEAGNHVAELADDVARFAAVENLFHQSVDEFGNPGNFETRKYDYVASISEGPPGFLAVNEDRINKLNDREGSPDGIGTSGFAALALIFHPIMRGNFDMRCEGLGDWHGEASWIVHFRQRDDKPSRIHSYNVNGSVYPVMLKGRAWITATTFRIVRIEAEMVRAIPEIRLLSEHQIVEYGPVRFEKKNTSLWLPKSAEIYFDFQRHRYYRRHSFDHYMLFSVDTEEKPKEPASPPEEKHGVAEDKKPN
jgi:tetratricopeptide (TPR) repeat protein